MDFNMFFGINFVNMLILSYVDYFVLLALFLKSLLLNFWGTTVDHPHPIVNRVANHSDLWATVILSVLFSTTRRATSPFAD